MFTFRPDDGLVPSLDLTIIIDGYPASSKRPTCWQEGIDGIKTRLKLLEKARKQKVSLFQLQKSFKVKWEHFEEWANITLRDHKGVSSRNKVFSIFTNHHWADELCGEGERFDQLRRDIGITTHELLV